MIFLLKEILLEDFAKIHKKNNAFNYKLIDLPKDIGLKNFRDLKISKDKIKKIIKDNISVQFALANLLERRFYMPEDVKASTASINSFSMNNLSIKDQEIFKLIFEKITINHLLYARAKIHENFEIYDMSDELMDIFKDMVLNDEINHYIKYFFVDKPNINSNISEDLPKYYKYYSLDSVKDDNFHISDPFASYLSYLIEDTGHYPINIVRMIDDLKDNDFLNLMVNKYDILIIEYRHYEENNIYAGTNDCPARIDFFKRHM